MAPAKELSMRELYTSALPLSLIYGISEKLGFENDTTTALRDSVLVKFGFRLASEGERA